MKDIISQIEDIRDLNRQHKLVVFVGAGVSKNSGVCSWWELVRNIADRIDFKDNCQKCKMEHLICSECDEYLELCSYDNYNCTYKYNFSVDDYLKIPQYFYDMYGKTEYNNLLKEKFCKPLVPNEIDNLIIELNPEHIITTNYDHLLEDVKLPNRSTYKVIKNDTNLLGEYGLHYIIKMHGDIDDIEKVVLKEDDYLNYSQNHILIETYIKSLLIDKTFLFIGYSLNDNNLRLIMSYIDYFAKKNDIKRSMHYLTTSNIPNKDRNIAYWKNKGIELVDLSKINDTMKANTKCRNIKIEQGQLLYSFLKYIKNDKLSFSNDKTTIMKELLLKNIKPISMFNFISYTTLLKVCNFEYPPDNLNGSIHFFNDTDYNSLKNIFIQNNEDSNKIKYGFAKAGIHSIQCYNKTNELMYYNIEQNYFETEDDFFELSIQYQYNDIINKLKSYPDNLEKAYYYSLIYRLNENKCQEVMEKIGEEIKSLDYNDLTYEDKYKLAVYEYNSISIRILNFEPNDSEKWDDFIKFLDKASEQSKAFEYIKKLIGDNGDIINKLNDHLIEQEEYYMKKSTMTKLGGTQYGSLHELQCIVYDYYFFYKKNYLMLDWFNNVEKVCEPYIKAILCTYYPDEYQYSNNSGFGRTQVEPYPLTLIDIDIIVRHTKLTKLNSWISFYKVFSIKLEDDIDISKLFENFCTSMRKFWDSYLVEQLKIFGVLISLIELTLEQKQRILNSFIKLVTPDNNIGIGMLRNSLSAIWSFVEKHFDNNVEYVKLLHLLINENLIKNPLDGKIAYENLIKKLSCCANEETYNLCSDMISNAKNNSDKCYYVYVYHKILLNCDSSYWQKWIIDNIGSHYIKYVYSYLLNGIIEFNDIVKKYFCDKLASYIASEVGGLKKYPDHKIDTINYIIILFLSGCIPNLKEIKFLEQYVKYSEYLDFLFNPDSFDYSKINTADYMWCNFINDTQYRDLILQHKSDFWTSDDKKRIKLGFGSDFENRTVYKYLFD